MNSAWALALVTFASLCLGGARVHAQEAAPTQAEVPHVTKPAVTDEAAPPVAPKVDDDLPDNAGTDDAATNAQAMADTSAEAAATANAHQQRRSSLELALQKTRDERADTSRLAPWLLTAGGIAAIAVGVSWGLSRSLGCSQRSCSTSFVPGWIVVGGTGMFVAGVIWLELKRRDVAELDRRRHYLEQELQYLEWNEARNLPLNDAQPTLAWRGTF